MININPQPARNSHISQIESIPNAPRKPWFAMLASLVLPGLGQFYNGELNRAIWLFLTFALLSVPGLVLVALYLPDGWMVPALAVGLLMTIGIWIYGMWQAWHAARTKQEYRAHSWQVSGVYALLFVLCDLVALPLLTKYVREHQVEPFRIPFHSMEPSVMQGDYIFADKRYNCPGCRQGVHRGDIAIFAYPNDRSVRYIKRVIALPGDLVEYRNQQFRVNGQPLQSLHDGAAAGIYNEQIDGRNWQVRQGNAVEPAQSESRLPPLNRAAVKPAEELNLRVPDGQVFVMGDNRGVSVDSRRFGTVPLQDILGRARQVWFSSDQANIRWARLGLVLQ
ncbi:MAG: signal peptidase I [Rhodoferax sp.]|nr:signal peptidase I [Rhodoferax sp.]